MKNKQKFIITSLLVLVFSSIAIMTSAQRKPDKTLNREDAQRRPVPTNNNATSSEDNTLLYLIGGSLVIVIVVGVLKKLQSEESKEEEIEIDRNSLETYQAHLIQDKEVTVDKVLESIKEMRPALNPSRKNGFTELDIEKQMLKHLRNVYQNVRNQKQMQDSNADGSRFIDIDVGHGKVGVEIKVWHKSVNRKKREDLLFQLESYKLSGYEKENVIAVFAGFNDIFRHPDIGKLEQEIVKRGHKFVFLNAGESV